MVQGSSITAVAGIYGPRSIVNRNIHRKLYYMHTGIYGPRSALSEWHLLLLANSWSGPWSLLASSQSGWAVLNRESVDLAAEHGREKDGRG